MIEKCLIIGYIQINVVMYLEQIHLHLKML